MAQFVGLYEKLNEDDWEFARSRLKVGWEAFLKYYLTLPNATYILLHSSALGATGINIFPIKHPDHDIYLGDVIIQTAWNCDLSPRPEFLSSDQIGGNTGPKTAIRFVPQVENLPLIKSAPPNLIHLEACLADGQEKNFNISVGTTNINRGDSVENIIKELNRRLGDFVNINVNEVLKALLVPLEVKSRMLVEVLDVLCYCIDAKWEWVGIKSVTREDKTIEQAQIYITPVNNGGIIFKYDEGF